MLSSLPFHYGLSCPFGRCLSDDGLLLLLAVLCPSLFRIISSLGFPDFHLNLFVQNVLRCCVQGAFKFFYGLVKPALNAKLHPVFIVKLSLKSEIVGRHADGLLVKLTAPANIALTEVD